MAPSRRKPENDNVAADTTEVSLSQLRRGVVEYCVLSLLRKQARYAPELVAELASSGMLTSEGTMYPLLSRLRKDGLVDTDWQESESGPPRRYYRLTRAGARTLETFRSEWALFSTTVDHIINGAP